MFVVIIALPFCAEPISADATPDSSSSERPPLIASESPDHVPSIDAESITWQEKLWDVEDDDPDFNVDGTPMIGGIDINGRPYGVTEEWANNPWGGDGYGGERAERICGNGAYKRST